LAQIAWNPPESLAGIFLTVLAGLAAWTLASGADDLYLFVAWALHGGRLRRAFPPPPAQVEEKAIAILIPLWKEHRVIRRMVEHNVSAVRYANYQIFLGVYPNDPETLEAASCLEEQFSNVHVALCPHEGPTSKADCLNWAFQRLLLFEETTSWKAEAVVVHDAEDVIHAESLRWISSQMDRFDMVQIPVLPLPTPWWDLVHGVYCDEFAEYQTKDVPARMLLGGFIPSNGVGTGYRRETLERLAQMEGNRIFDPECLTEDYEIGCRVHQLGFRQVFVPPGHCRGSIVATREYFPRTWRAAIQQRTRWITGIVFQGWERHGWRGNWRDAYFWWRDRKGLLGNPLSCLSYLLLFAAPALLRSGLLPPFPGWSAPLLSILLLFQALSLAARMAASARIYGWRFAAAVPFRVPVANVINSIAALRAFGHYVAARWAGRPLLWLKTEHRYPSRAALAAVGGVTLSSGAIAGHESRSNAQLRRARGAAV
jgi:adsorption protein B